MTAMICSRVAPVFAVRMTQHARGRGRERPGCATDWIGPWMWLYQCRVSAKPALRIAFIELACRITSSPCPLRAADIANDGGSTSAALSFALKFRAASHARLSAIMSWAMKRTSQSDRVRWMAWRRPERRSAPQLSAKRRPNLGDAFRDIRRSHS